MAIKKASLTALEPWQERYLTSDGKRLTYDDFSPHWLDALPFWKLCDGERPVYLDPAKARHPSALWREHGGEYLDRFIADHPGTRPLPWWMWDAPDAANPTDQGSDPDRYEKAVKQAQKRSRWAPEKQTALLRARGLLSRSEEKAIGRVAS